MAIGGLAASPGQQILFDGKELAIRNPRDAIGEGIYLAPENRRTQGLVVEMSVRENITLPSLPSYSSLGLISRRRESKSRCGAGGAVEGENPNG